MQVIALRLNVKLSPDQERQLLESSMVPMDDGEDHILVIETASAMPAPVAAQQLAQPPVTPGPGDCRVCDVSDARNQYYCCVEARRGKSRVCAAILPDMYRVAH